MKKKDFQYKSYPVDFDTRLLVVRSAEKKPTSPLNEN